MATGEEVDPMRVVTRTLLLLLALLLSLEAGACSKAPGARPMHASSAAAAATYRLLVWGDARPRSPDGTGVSPGLPLVVSAMRARAANDALALGDYVLISRGQQESLIRAKYASFFAAYRQLHVRTDFTMGNHEAVSSAARSVYSNLFGRTYYVVQRGPLHIIVLSTEQPGLNGRIGFYGINDPRDSVQARWLVRQLQSIKDRRAWIVVAMHRPFFEPKANDPFATSARAEHNALVRLFHSYGVDIVLGGHLHYYRRHLQPDGTTYITEGMAGGPPNSVDSVPLGPGDVAAFGSGQENAAYGYCLLTARAGHVSGRMYYIRVARPTIQIVGDSWNQSQVARTAP
jgi:hypothetical protein